MSDDIEFAVPTYGTLKFLVQHGNWIALLVAAVPLAAGIAVAFLGWSLGFVAAGFAGSAFLYLIMRSYVEMVRLIVDMLLPK